MPFTRYSTRCFVTLLFCLGVVGCGKTDSKSGLAGGAKGKGGANVGLPNEAGKAVLDELGVTELQVKPAIVDSKKALQDTKKNPENSDEESSEGALFVRPSSWILSDELPSEFWEVQYFGNRPIGYLHQIVMPSPTGAAGILRIDAESFVRVSKEKKSLEQYFNVTSIEESDGRLRTIEARTKQGTLETKTDGMVILGLLRLKTQSPEKATGIDIPWPKECGGPFAVAQSMRGRPMRPGETRRLLMLDPVLGQIVKVKLESKEYVKTPLIDGNQHSLLEIHSEVRAGDKKTTSTLWTNMSGETLKTYTSAWDIRSFRVERSVAESIRDAAACEKLTKTKVKLKSPIEGLASKEKLDFRIGHTERDPFQMLPGRTNQSVKSTSAFTALATVFAMKEKSVVPVGVTPELTLDPLYSKPSPFIQSDDERVKKLAEQFYNDKSDEKSVLERLRRGVFNWIEKKTEYSPLMSSAAEAARERSGDSTEHAALLAAIVRARNVPSRVAFGLVYNESKTDPALVFHAWTEVYLKDHWLCIDASVEKPNTNASYLKLVDSPLADQNPYAPLLAALTMIRDLEIDITK
jgi:Transglutaminase-like superfamily